MIRQKRQLPKSFSVRNSTVFRVFFFTVVLLGVAILSSAYLIISQYSEKLLQSEISAAKETVTEFSKEAIIQTDFVSTVTEPSYLLSHEIEEVMLDIKRDLENAYTRKTANIMRNYFESCGYLNQDMLEMLVISTEGAAYHYTAPGSGMMHMTLVSYPYFQMEEISSFMQTMDAMMVFYDPAPSYMTKTPTPVITYVRKIYNTSNTHTREVIGIVLINFLYEDLYDHCRQSFLNKGGTMLIVDRDERIVYSSNPEDIEEHFADYSSEKDRVEVMSIELGLFEMTAVGVISEEQLFREVDNLQYTQFCIVILSVAIGIVISWIVFKAYYRRTSQLVLIMQKTDLSLRAPVSFNDEISLIAQTYNDMCEQMQEWINRHYRSQLQLRTAELQTLTAQLNPHYVFNTLESIRMQAVLAKDERVANMLLQFGYLFRWAMRTNCQVVRLEEELEYIRAYWELQCARFSESPKITITVKDDLLDYATPKLILQPIVENAITHGMSDVCNAPHLMHLNITVSEEENDLVFCVEDNGCGIPSNKLKEVRMSLNAYAPEEKGSINIGCRNVHNRLKLMFGDSYGLAIESTEGLGTTVCGRYPKMSLEEMSAIV